MLLTGLVTGLATISSVTALPFRRNSGVNGTTIAPANGTNGTSATATTLPTVGPSNYTVITNTTTSASMVVPTTAFGNTSVTVLPGGSATAVANNTVYHNYTVYANQTVTQEQLTTFTAIVGGTTVTQTVGGETITTEVGGTTIETELPVASATSSLASSTGNPNGGAGAPDASVPSCQVVQSNSSAYFKPKVLIINMFEKEQTAWVQNLNLTENITVPMLSPSYPHVHANKNLSIMSFTTGEAEANAAASMTALLSSPLFDFTETYFLISGIAGGSPVFTTIGSVTFAKFAVQIGSAYELDSRDVPANWSYGYVNYGTDEPNKYPKTWYGTEVFELNENLRNRAIALAADVTLTNGTEINAEMRALYNATDAAYNAPKVVACDTATSDVYWKGVRLAQWAENTVHTFTNGSATYCSTQQEDNASLEAILRAAQFGLADFNRVVLSRSISHFDRPPTDMSIVYFPCAEKTRPTDRAGESAALTNLYSVGLPFVEDVVSNWDSLYKVNHFVPKNYTGDVLETLGGKKNF